MNFWDVLCISPTDNVSIIKKAYAKKLKEHHPEDDPKGYQMVREAYDKALAYSKNHTKNKERNDDINQYDNINNKINFRLNNITVNDPVDSINKPPHIDLINSAVNRIPHHETLVNNFIEAAQNLYADFFTRIDIENWRALLNSEAAWYIDSKELLRDRMMRFLEDNHYFPKNIWQLFNTTFLWTEKERFFLMRYSKELMLYIYKQVNMADEIPYCNFKKTPDIDYAAYVAYREKAFLFLDKLDLEAAWFNISKAYEIYAEDSFLLRLKGEYYLLSKDFSNALSIFNQLISLNLNDTAVLCDLGKCYFGMDDLTASKNYFLQILQIDPSHKEAKSYLKQIKGKLQLKLHSKPLNRNFKKDLIQIEKVLGIYMPGSTISKKRFKPHRRVFLKRPSLALFALAAFLVLLLLSDTGWPSIKEKITSPFHNKTVSIDSTNNFENLYMVEPNKTSIKVNIPSAQFLNLCKVDKNNTTIYIPEIMPNIQYLSNLVDGYSYVCIAKLGDKKIILLANYDQVEQINKTGCLDNYQGTVYSDPSKDLLNAVIESYKESNMPDSGTDNIITDIYLSGEKPKSTGDWRIASLLFVLIINSIILIIKHTSRQTR